MCVNAMSAEFIASRNARIWSVVMRRILLECFAWAGVVVCVLFLMSPWANAGALREENAALKELLARCLSRGEHPVWIGGELWFCGATATGIKNTSND